MPDEISVDASQLSESIGSLLTASDSMLEGVRVARAHASSVCAVVPDEMMAFQSAFEVWGQHVGLAMTNTHARLDENRESLQSTAQDFDALDRETATDLQRISKAAQEIAPGRYVVPLSGGDVTAVASGAPIPTDGDSTTASATPEPAAAPVSATPVPATPVPAAPTGAPTPSF